MLSVDGLVLGLAVNPGEDQLYMSDAYDKKIVVTSLNGSGRRPLIDRPDKPFDLTVDLNRR